MARRDATAYVDELMRVMESIDPVEIDYRYDTFSDTLFASVLPQPQPGISITLRDGWMIRVHRDTDQVIGLQIENLMSQAVKQHPSLAVLVEGPLTKIEHRDPAFEDQSIAAINQFREFVPRVEAAGD